MTRHEFLRRIHQLLQPRNYLEIGVNEGRSLVLSSTRSIGVDPAYKVTAEIACDVKLVRAPSDDFFARPDALAWFSSDSVDFAFIDGLHVFEQALRDFMNVERCSHPTTVAIFDDMLPRRNEEASRKRHTVAWTGDVYKVALVLERYRPDLVVVPIDSQPTGLVLVLGLDRDNTTLADHYDEILEEFATLDPQTVPERVLRRLDAANPDLVLESQAWPDIVRARAAADGLPESAHALRQTRGTGNTDFPIPAVEPWPPAPKVAPAAPRVPTPVAVTPQSWTLRRVVRAVKSRI